MFGSELENGRGSALPFFPLSLVTWEQPPSAVRRAQLHFDPLLYLIRFHRKASRACGPGTAEGGCPHVTEGLLNPSPIL
jgi:hypothetical protein